MKQDDAHLQEMNPLYSKIEQSILSLSSSQMKEVEEFLSKLNTGSTPSMTPATSSENVQASLSEPSGQMSQQAQAPQIPQMQQQTMPDMSTFGGMSQQGFQMSPPSVRPRKP